MEEARKKMKEWLMNLVGSSLVQNGDDSNHVKIHDVVRDFVVKYAFKRLPPPRVQLDGKDESTEIEMLIFSPPGETSNDDDNSGRRHYNVEINPGHQVLVRDFTVKHAVRSQYELDGKESLKIETFIAPAAETSCRESNDHIKIAVHDFVEKLAGIKGRHVLVLEGGEPRIFISQAAELVGGEMESLFQGMDKLKVVHLDNICFTKGFPSPSVEDLVTLCLHNCNVKDMTGIGNLKGSLQVLSFCGSTVAKLLKEVGELSKLRSLDFRGCPKVGEIEAGALEGLSGLEELFLGNAFGNWGKVVVEESGERINASLAELNSMPHLATLDIIIPDPTTMLPQHLPAFTQLQTYTIRIGPQQLVNKPSSDNNQLLPSSSRIMMLNLESDRVLFNGWFQATLQTSQQLHLDGFNDDDTNRSSIHELCINGFEELKHLEVKNSPSTRYIILSTKWFPCTGFSSLEFLSLFNMMNLEMIGQGLLSPESFGRLKVVKVNDCNSLKSLFCLSAIHGLSQLESIHVVKCGVMQAVVVDEEEEEEEDKRIENDEDDKLDDHHHHKEENTRVFFKCLPAGKLTTKITGKSETRSTENNAASDNKLVKVQKSSKNVVTEDGKIIMYGLRHLTLERLSNFSTFFAKVNPDNNALLELEDKVHSLPACLFLDDQVSLPKLTSLTLRSLERLKEIWQITNSPMDLDNLQSLVVEHCSNLLNIFHPILVEKKLHKLESLEVSWCRLVQKVFDLDELVSVSGGKRQTATAILPQLKVLKLTALENLKYIISNKYPRELSGFQNLTSLDVIECGELEYLFTSSMAKAMKKLANIKVESCGKMKAIVKEELVEHGGPASRLEFPDLKVLWIRHCPNMASFSTKQEEKEKGISSRDMVASKGSKFSMKRANSCCGNNPQELIISSGRAGDKEESTAFFNPKVHLPSLVDLLLSELGKFTQIWSNETPAAESFSKLAGVNVSYCHELIAAFPAAMLDRLKDVLKEIKIYKCGSVKVLFELHSASDITVRYKQPVVFPYLKDIYLFDLPKLQHVVEKDSEIVVGFPGLMRLDVSVCAMLRYLMPIATAKTLSKLETLRLAGSSIEEVIRGGDLDENQMDYNIVFPLLSWLELHSLENLVYFSSASYQLDFPSLKKLSIYKCMKMKIFSPVATCERFEFEEDAEYLFNEKVGLPKLEELRICEMQLKELWSNEPPFAGSFCQLKLLQVERCNELQNIIPSFMLQTLQNLARLTVKCCERVQHIVGARATSGNAAFPCLTYLELFYVQKLSSFTPTMAIELPALQDVSIGKCSCVDAIAAVKVASIIRADGTTDSNATKILRPLFWFDQEISMPSLEKLTVGDMDELKMICYGCVSANGLSKLSEISVRECNNLDTSLFHLNMLPSLTNLENLSIYKCESLQVIYDLLDHPQLDLDEKYSSYTVVAAAASAIGGLRVVRLERLPELKYIWRSGVDDDDDPKASAGSIFLKFEKLSSVKVSECKKLSYIFPASAAKSLSQIKNLDIYNCRGLEEIVGGRETKDIIDSPSQTFIFPELDTLKLDNLEKLKCFCGGIYSLECPSLSELKIARCSSLQLLFASDSTTFQQLMKEHPLFLVHKESFPVLKKLAISNSSKLRRIWRHSTAWPLIKLTEVEIVGCNGLEETLFPADTLEIFVNLEELHLSECNSLKVIYDVENAHQSAAVTAVTRSRNAKLKKLHLKSLPELEHIWNGDPKETLSCCFQSLTSVCVTNCASLEYLFPASVARRDLLRLNQLTPSKCKKLKEIIARDPKLELEEDANNRGPPAKFLFPRVTSLELKDLPELRCLYPGPHISRWPLLENLIISNCISIRNLVSNDEYPPNFTGNGTPKQPFFLIDQKKLCLLKTLTLVWNDDMERKWSDQSFHPELFPKLRVVNLEGYSGEPLHLPSSSLVYKLHIEKLTVRNASCEEVLFQRDDEERPKVAHFTKLELNRVRRLKNIWEENFEFASMFKNLESLQVSGCAELIKVLPSSISFSSLTSLAVSGCRKMTAVMTLQAAKSLTQLSKMSVSECDALVEIVATDDDGGNDGACQITFSQLKYLKLSFLESLTCFCSGKLNFPVLQELVLEKCPRFTSFNQQALSTPNLKKMQTAKGSLLVRDNLNTTIIQWFKEQLASLETLIVSPIRRDRWLGELSRSWSLEQWLDELPPSWSFDALKKLIIEEGYGSQLLSTAIPVDKALVLRNLENLEVRNCHALHQVFDDSALALGTNSCGSRMAGIFKNLRSITINKCGSLRYILTTAVMLNLSQLRDINIGDCLMLEEIVQIRQEDEQVEEEGTSSSRNKETSAIEFPNLETITLERLPKLETFCQLGNTSALNCPSLKNISITECHQMKTFAGEMPGVGGQSNTSCITDNDIIQEHFFCAKVQLPILEDLILSYMDGLTKIWHGGDPRTTTLGNLEKVFISRCPKLKYIFPASLATSLVKLKKLRILNCGGLEEIVAEGENAVERLVFPKVDYLEFGNLPELKCFYPGILHTLEWPLLRMLKLSGCTKVEILIASNNIQPKRNLLTTQVHHLSDQIQITKQHLFSAGKVLFPSLQSLILYEMDGLSKLFPDKLEGTMLVKLGNLERVNVYRCPGLKYIFPASVATTLVKLNYVYIGHCRGLEQVVAAGNNGSESAISNNGLVLERRQLVFPTVSVLRLEDLPELKSFYTVGILPTWEWPMLEKLIVSGCHKIETLALDIESCKKSNLLLSDEAQVQAAHLVNQIRTKQPLFLIGKDAFPRLEKMYIGQMDNIKTIWEAWCNDGNSSTGGDGWICFKRLEDMELRSLPRLMSFSSTSRTLFFPSLKQVEIVGCPDMKIFSVGSLLTPIKYKAQIRLQGMTEELDTKEPFQASLNTTIQDQSTKKHI